MTDHYHKPYVNDSHSYNTVNIECTIEADEVQGKCHVVFGEEIDDLDTYFLKKPDVFWFSEVTINSIVWITKYSMFP